MTKSITLAVDVEADPTRVYEILSSTEGQQSFWTADCEINNGKARFGFAEAPADLTASVSGEPGKLVRMTTTGGFPGWEGTTWEWELGQPARIPKGTGVHFRHYGFGADMPDADLGYVAQVWAMIQDRLAKYAASGSPQPFFPAS